MDREASMDGVKVGPIPSKGEGLIATRDLLMKDVLYEMNYPIMMSISAENLPFFCYHCCAASKPDPNRFSIGQYRDSRLQKCTGCNLARFCGKGCQRSAWKAYHKFECKRMTLRGVLHESVRAVQRFCLQRDNGLVDDEQWAKVLSLVSHVEETQRAGGDRWVNLMLYAKAAHEYSATKQPLHIVLKLMCILKYNGMALQTTSGDPIGVFLDLLLVKVNHGCERNVFVHRPVYTNTTGWMQHSNRVMAQLLPLREIAEGEELAFPYADLIDDAEERRAGLQEDYLFTCMCAACTRGLDAKRKRENIDPSFANSVKSWQFSATEALKIVKQQTQSPDSIAVNTVIGKLEEVSADAKRKGLITTCIHSYDQINHELKILYLNQQRMFDKGLICELQNYFIIEPLICVSPLDPSSVVNAIYLLELLALLDETYFPNSGHSLDVIQARENIEARGFGRQSFTYWRVRISEDFRVALLSCSRNDVAEFFQRELVTIFARYQADIRNLLNDKGAVEKSHTELRNLIGPVGEKWKTDAKKTGG